jgi:transposase
MNTKLFPTPAEKLQLAALAAARPRRRFPRSGVVHYRPDVSDQMDFVRGSPALAVPSEHVAWMVKGAVGLFDLSALKAKSSPLGRHGISPEHLLGAWLLGSLEGTHSASALERRIETDAAYRLVCGGQPISASSLRNFRRKNLLLLNGCFDRTLELAQERGYLDLQQAAVDSVRIEADAAGASIRTATRSGKLVKELSAKDTSEMTDEQRGRHEKRLEKHRAAVEHCQQTNVTNYSETDPLAALMKFPHGGSKPGHRLTTAVAGAAVRFCLAFYISSAPTDHGLLGPALEALRSRLRRIGIPDSELIRLAADAGFSNEDDISVAFANDLNVDVTLAQSSFAGAGDVGPSGMFGKARFKIEGDKCTCPAGTLMRGPYKDDGDFVKWFGVGCGSCPLRKQCTTADARKIKHNPVTARQRDELRTRMQRDERKAFYSKRSAVVESMYSVVEDTMGFRRVSSRHPGTTQAETVLKLVAYNLSRLWAADAAARKTTRTAKAGASEGCAPSGDGASADSCESAVFLSLLDVSDWPLELLDAVLDFTLALQASNSANPPAADTNAQSRS